MREVPFEETIAERKMVLRRNNGEVLDVTLQIGRPVPFSHNPNDFACPFRLVGLSKEERMYQVGVDSAQALELVYRILPSWLQLTASIHGGKLETWGEAGHGFPEWPGRE